MAIQNQPTYFVDSSLVSSREVELPNADWQGGVNTGASCAPVIGANTGDYDPKAQDWPRENPRIQNSQVISGIPSGVFTIDATFGDNALAVWCQSQINAQPNDQINVISGFDVYNRTGAFVPIDSWLWAVANNP